MTPPFAAAQSSAQVSFEFFPPKMPEAEDQLWRAIKRLEPLAPSFVSVTYGAGGSTRNRTHATVKRIIDETSLAPAAHLTCVGATRSQIDGVIQDYWDAGVRHIVALRGDMPSPGQAYEPHKDGYKSTPELIGGILDIGQFEVSVSCYPERHPDSPSLEHDIDLLRRKMEAGATRAISQFCFNPDTLADFRDRAVRAGVHIPIIPGLMPTTNFKGVCRMAQQCGTAIPDWLADLYFDLDADPESRRAIAALLLAKQVHRLSTLGFSHFHFYTLNQADLTYAACRTLGLGRKTVQDIYPAPSALPSRRRESERPSA